MALPTPPSEPSQHHHQIVALESRFCPIPDFKLPTPHTYSITSYPRTEITQIADRIRDASILITTTIPIRADVLSATVSPNLRIIAVMATGTDSIDLEACRARGILVCNCGGANVVAVSEHAVGMYFSVRRRFVETQWALRRGEWMEKGSLVPMLKDDEGGMPLTCREEVVALVGYGTIGMS